MELEKIYTTIKEYCETTHGSSVTKEEFFVMGDNKSDYSPLSFIKKKLSWPESEKELQSLGFIYASHTLKESDHFLSWYEKQYAKKLELREAKKIKILFHPIQQTIFNALDTIYKNYEILRSEQIVLNSKNLPVQVGEWYAKTIFGLNQVKSSSQKGFDFVLNSLRFEVKVHWSEKTSHKGVKIRKSLVQLCQYCIIIYVAKNFLIKDICLLDSNFILRKFDSKGHTLFLKDGVISQYFFSRSSKHFDKIVNPHLLLKFASPTLAVKIEENLPKD